MSKSKIAKTEKRESLRALVRDLKEQYGKPSAEDIKWAERALASLHVSRDSLNRT